MRLIHFVEVVELGLICITTGRMKGSTLTHFIFRRKRNNLLLVKVHWYWLVELALEGKARWRVYASKRSIL